MRCFNVHSFGPDRPGARVWLWDSRLPGVMILVCDFTTLREALNEAKRWRDEGQFTTPAGKAQEGGTACQ